jgi:zinc transporter
VIQEELSARLAERLNRRLYLFTVVASIFLPLTFFTGLLGANVDGIPYADRSWAFALVAGICVAIAAAQFAILRVMRLL